MINRVTARHHFWQPITHSFRACQQIAIALIMLSLHSMSLADTNSAVYSLRTVTGDLNYPWAMVHLPDRTMLVTERSGLLKQINPSSGQVTVISGTPEVYFAGQGGLMDIALHPEFDQNRTLFLSYAHGDATANATAVYRARLEGDRLVDGTTIFKARPLKDSAVHYGARMAFLPDGTMLLTVGDGFEMREAAQRSDSHLGSILRITVDGQAASGNPDLGESALAELYSTGHRNPQGLIHDSISNTIWAHEHGPRGGDEINLIIPGSNYGWPIATSGLDYSGARISPWSTHEGYEAPLLEWSPSIAPADLILYRGSAFPEWQGDLFIAALAARHVRRVSVEGNRVQGESVLFEELEARIRAISEDSNGMLYLLTDSASGKLIQISPNQ